MKKHLSNIDHELGYLIRQGVIFTEATTATMLSRKFSNHLHEIQNGLYTLLKNKLSPSLIPISDMENALERAANAAG